MASDPRIKQIKIKTGVVSRLMNEKKSYEKEAKQIESKITKMKDDGKDEYDIRKQEEVLQETKAMVPDSLRRLKKAFCDLEELLEKEKPDLAEDEHFIKGREVLDQGREMFD